MRNLKTLILFAVITVVMLIAAIVFRSASVTSPAIEAGLVLPNLAQQLATVQTIKIIHAGDSVTLQRQAQAWTVVEKANYPAAESKIRELLLGLAYLKRLEPKTKNPDNYAILGLTDPDKKNQQSGSVYLYGSDWQAYSPSYPGAA
jgi:hypothetical protein